jgi:hypothetical protein
VSLQDPDQLDGILDKVKRLERMPLLRKIEAACQRSGDETALATLDVGGFRNSMCADLVCGQT